MGPLIVFTTVFCVAWAIIYIGMRLSCWLKKEYCSAENLLCRIMVALMCESCRQSCENHKKLIVRSILFALLIAAVFMLARYLR